MKGHSYSDIQRLWALPLISAFIVGFILANIGRAYQIDLLYRIGLSVFSLVLIAGAIKEIKTGVVFTNVGTFPRAERPIKFWITVLVVIAAAIIWFWGVWFRFPMEPW